LTVARQQGIAWLAPTILITLGFAVTDLGDYRRAVAALHEGLALGRLRGNLGGVVDALEGLGRLGAATGQAEPAARLFGAAAALRDEIASPLSPTEVARFASAVTALRAAGRELARDEALALAFAVQVEQVGSATAAEDRPATTRGLTEREFEILRLLAAGQSNREIGERLFISPATAARHVATIFAKLGVASRARATAHAHRHGLL
jgi:DNA-binding CsgD family transcriptional regulator